ncbi:HAMP domain-containing protein, partial [bacterium]
MKKKRVESNSSRGLDYKLRIAVALMAVIPILVCLYLLSHYISLQKGLRSDTLVALVIVVFISGLGFLLIKQVFNRIAAITLDAKLIAAGDYGRSVKIKDGDEVSDLARSLNQLTRNIRNDMDELKKYGEKTAEINIEVQKRIVVVSSLLQISSLISEGAKIGDILKLSVEKSRLIGDSDVAYLVLQEDDGLGGIYVKVADGINMQSLVNAKMRVEDSIFNKVVRTNKYLAIDSDNRQEGNEFLDFQDKFKSRNTLMHPVYLKGRVAGVLGVGNTKDVFIYRKDDVDLLDLFAKQVAIALENEMLSSKIEKLEITDGLTGLYNNAFIHNRLNEEIKRAIVYQRPCSFVLLNIDNFQKLRSEFSSLETESVLK